MYIVTGANGFIGSAFVRYLNNQNIHDIICVDIISTNTRPELLAAAKFKKFIVYPEIFSWLENNRSVYSFKGIFHFGAISSTTETNWDSLLTHNIQLSQRLFEFSQLNKIPFLYASSAAVYGDGSKGFSDQHPTKDYQPLNLYGKSKLEFDLWIESQTNNQSPWYGFRFFNVYGPNEYHKNNMSSLVYKAYMQIKNDSQLKLFRSNDAKYKNGEQLRDFIYIKDIVKWIWQFYNKLPTSGIYNMGSGQANTWLHLAACAFQALSTPLRIEWIDMPQNVRSQYQNFTEADMKKTFNTGIEKPLYSLQKGIEDYYTQYLMTSNSYL